MDATDGADIDTVHRVHRRAERGWLGSWHPFHVTPTRTTHGSGRNDAHSHRDRFPGVPRDPRRRVLGHPHRPGARELPDREAADLGVPRSRTGSRDGQAGLRARERRDRCAGAGQGRAHRPSGPASDRRGVPRRVRGGCHPGRCRHLDQHERERGHHQHRPRDGGPREGRLRVPVADRRHQPQPVDERRLPDGDQGRPRADVEESARGARAAAPVVPDQVRGVPRRLEGRAHPAAGCRAHDARAGVPRLRHDARRGLQPP
ncbi:hypothetical protein QE412_001324 [Microbacterium trichothecenolyticum]|uniref:Uncharacterized protein n=1 Tax=Microbacterium trichothecenolyticum TaxID=69370 RepID=A0ABU0TSW2_MICTR|nr:hypothetical protein [Microbacterium trichothecenolyticum]